MSVEHGTLGWAVAVTRDAFTEEYPAEYVDLDALRILVEHAEQTLAVDDRPDCAWAVWAVTDGRWSQVWARGVTEDDAEDYRQRYIRDSQWRRVPHTEDTVLVRPITDRASDLPDAAVARQRAIIAGRRSSPIT